DADGKAALAHASSRCDPGTEAQVAAGVMRDRGPVVREPRDVVVVEPDRMGRRKMRPEHAESFDMGRQGAAVALHAGDRLHLRFREMHMEAEAGLAGERAAAGEEIVAAVERNRRREGKPRLGRIKGPTRDDGFERRQGFGGWRESKPLDSLALRRRQRVEKPIDGLIEVMVGNHRREHDPKSSVPVAAGGRFQPLEARQGKLVEKVVAGSRAQPDHIEPAQKACEIFVFQRPVTVEAGTRIEEELERPAVARTLSQMAMAMRVGIDEARHEQPVGSIDNEGSCRGLEARRSNLADRIPRYQNVGWLRGVALDVEDATAADYAMTDLRRHRLMLPKCNAAWTIAHTACGSSPAPDFIHYLGPSVARPASPDLER